ncbi:ubiquitin-binding SDF ubiquitin ligase complex subunit met30 [Coemansia sp. RSA 1365]|nr:ubiquitin-binding SDF ubiquitin ligase complex subunit met30 [Coemansia sp. RSA 1365]
MVFKPDTSSSSNSRQKASSCSPRLESSVNNEALPSTDNSNSTRTEPVQDKEPSSKRLGKRMALRVPRILPLDGIAADQQASTNISSNSEDGDNFMRVDSRVVKPIVSIGGRKRDFSEYSTESSPQNRDLASRRKYPAFGGKCYRHTAQVYLAECNDKQRQLQLSLGALPHEEQVKISGIWRDFASETAERRLLILQGLVNLCCIPQLSYLNRAVPQQLRVDFMAAAPPDISLKILSYLDAKSLCQAAQVSRTWASLANDDILWHRMCVQHIDKVCKKCGWGLPLLDRSGRRIYEATARRALRLASSMTNAVISARSATICGSEVQLSASAQGLELPPPEANIDTYILTNGTQHQQMIPVSSLVNSSELDSNPVSSVCSPQDNIQFMNDPHTSGVSPDFMPIAVIPQRALRISGREEEGGNASDSSSTVAGNNHGHRSKRRPWKEIFAERQIVANNWRKFRYRELQVQAHADGILCVQFNEEYMITGSYDSKVHVWDSETMELVSELTGHTMPVRALEFDECKLFSGSLDGTVKIWDYRTGTCIRTLRVFDNGGVISLHHRMGTLVVGGESGTIRVYNIAKMTSFELTGHTDWVNSVRLYGANTLFSCSDDMLVKRWDLEQRRCVRTFSGHSHHVQSLQLSSNDLVKSDSTNRKSGQQQLSSRNADNNSRPFMITGSLDSTMRVWDIETGECLDTIFGHIEGIWSLEFDSLRIVTGSNDGTVKVWDTSSHACLFTLKTTSAAINCVSISDTCIIVGDNDGYVRVYDFRDTHSLEAIAATPCAE